MSKTGIVAYILAAIFVGFCFLMVGCSTEDCSSTKITNQNDDDCIDSFDIESSSSQTNSSSSVANE